MSKSRDLSKFPNNSATVADGIASLVAENVYNGRKVQLTGFYADTPWGFSRLFEYDETKAHTAHDGWSVINPDHLSTVGSANWYTAGGDATPTGGTGCWVREIPLTTIQAVELGAKGDATNDDITAIQAGITAMASNPLAIIEFSEGTYNVSANIELEDHTTLLGSGNAKIVATSTNYCVLSDYKEYLTLEGIEFEAPNTNSIIWFGVSQNIHVTKCKFTHTTQSTNSNVAGIRVGVQAGTRYTEAKNIWIEDCEFKTTSSDILMQPDSTSVDGINNVYVRGNYVDCSLKRTDGGADLLKFDGNGYDSSSYIVSGNVIDLKLQSVSDAINFEEQLRDVTASMNIVKNGNCDSGIKFFHGQKNEPVDRLTISHNIIKNCGNETLSRAIQISNVVSFDAVTISGNVIKDFDGIGLYLYSVTGATVTGNSVYDITATTGEGDSLFIRGCTDMTVTGNVFRSCVNTCEIRDASNITINGNSFKDVPKIFFNGGSDIIFSNNTCIESASTGSNGWIQISAGALDGILISNNRITTSDTYSIWNGTGQANIRIVGNVLSKPLGSNDWSAVRATDNIGFVTSNSGISSIADGGTIAHGLDYTTGVAVHLTTIDGTHIASVTSVDATNITVALKDNAGTSVGVAENVHWQAISGLENS